MMRIRLERASGGADADDVVAGFNYVLALHRAFSPGSTSLTPPIQN
jgi:hypothetical protein